MKSVCPKLRSAFSTFILITIDDPMPFPHAVNTLTILVSSEILLYSHKSLVFCLYLTLIVGFLILSPSELQLRNEQEEEENQSITDDTQILEDVAKS